MLPYGEDCRSSVLTKPLVFTDIHVWIDYNLMMIKVLFICMGNICRSPTAHGVFQHRVNEAGLSDKILVDSAGTHSYHIGHSPDSRSQATALERGFDLSEQRAQKLTPSLGEEFDYLIVMDDTNLYDASEIVASKDKYKLQYFLSYGEHAEEFVPDPYYGGDKGFEHVLDLVESASTGLLKAIRNKHGL